MTKHQTLGELVCVTDWGPSIGSGHHHRQTLIANCWKDMGGESRVIRSEEFGPDIGEVDVLSIDMPGAARRFTELASTCASVTVVFDDPVAGDLLPTLAVSILPNSRLNAARLVVTGVGLICHSKILHEVRQRVPSEPPEFDFAISLGAADVQRFSYPLAVELASEGSSVLVIQGPFAQEVPIDSRITVVSAPEFVAPWLRAARTALTNGATTMSESLFISQPTVAIAQTPAEERFAQYLSAPVFRPDEVVALFGTGRLSSHLNAQCSDSRAISWDGRGAQRLTSIIASELERAREWP